jgi:mannose/cellobiose epimerase-like protein (N-acyl-D-glucosamine 2-epimerase family)
MNALDFTFSDLIAGYVTAHDPAADAFTLKTIDDREYRIQLTSVTYAELVRNLGEAYQDATGQLRDLLEVGRFLFAHGIFYPAEGEAGTPAFEAKHVVLLGRRPDEFRFESQDWWIKQIRQLVDFDLRSEFCAGPIDFRAYRTNLSITGDKLPSGRQETDTLSRMVYGFASAFLLTGEDRYLEAAEAGVAYMREHMCFVDKTEGIGYWYHAIDVQPDGTDSKVFASEFGDDFDAIPCYEQIYALVGQAQTFRITGDRRILDSMKLTMNLFHRHFEDHTDFPDGTPRRGYYSHLDPITLSPLSPALDDGGRGNRDRKNWNSVGDHIPAYLINLYLATGVPDYADALEDLCDTVIQHFFEYDTSPFVQERFHGDWTPDRTHGWQQDRAIVGHNLKIAWNLMRVNNLRPKAAYVARAETIASLMPGVGGDLQRGGWYDTVERRLQPGQTRHRLVWHDRKAWWQQEQGILAYLILDGVLQKPEYQAHARQSAAFYNAWFLDVDSGGVYFDVLANGLPYALGTERQKGSHSTGYHSTELAFLAAVYTNLLVTGQPMDFYFKPKPGAWPDGILRVAPDLLPPGSVRLEQVWINGQEHRDFDPVALTVRLPDGLPEMKVRVRLVPAQVVFSADLLDLTNGTARISLAGSLGPEGLPILQEQVGGAIAAGCAALVLEVSDLVYLAPEGVRYLALTKQHQGPDFALSFAGVRGQVEAVLRDSELDQEVSETLLQPAP